MTSAPSRTPALIRLFREHLRPYTGWVTAIVSFQIIGTVASLVLPALNADIVDQGIVPGDVGVILRLGLIMLFVSLIQIAANIIGVRFGALTAMSFGRDLRSRIFHGVAGFSSREVDRFGASSLITRNTNDVQQIQMLAMTSFAMLVTAPIMFVGGVALSIREEPDLAWLVAIIVPVMVLAAVLIVRRMVPAYRRIQEHLDSINKILREQITGIRVVRAFVREPHEAQRFGHANDELTNHSIWVGKWMALIFPFMMLIVNVSSVAVLWFGADLLDQGRMEIGSLGAFLVYLSQILMATMMSTMSLAMIPRASVSASRIAEVLDTESSVVVQDGGRTTPSDSKAGVVFDKVSFHYAGASDPVVSDITFAATPGQTTAIIGSTGAGKSTLLNLIPRLFDATGGAVSVAGVDVTDYEPDALWHQIGLVPQQAYLFSGTVASNLLFGKADATEEELWDALRIAQAEDFVRAMPDGLNSAIAQGGTNVSGGQRQRLAIARALVRRPSVYLFDDSFSALDVATDAQLRAALEPIVVDATVITVAQRVATIVDADQIIVLEAGSIVGVGTHDELLKSCATYREIVDSQLRVEAGGPAPGAS